MSYPNRRPTAREKLADWTLAYAVIYEEIVPMFVMRDAPAEMAAQAAIAGRRTAALAAAILVANAGVERAVVTVAEEADPYMNGGYGPEERP